MEVSEDKEADAEETKSLYAEISYLDADFCIERRKYAIIGYKIQKSDCVSPIFVVESRFFVFQEHHLQLYRHNFR